MLEIILCDVVTVADNKQAKSQHVSIWEGIQQLSLIIPTLSKQLHVTNYLRAPIITAMAMWEWQMHEKISH